MLATPSSSGSRCPSRSTSDHTVPLMVLGAARVTLAWPLLLAVDSSRLVVLALAVSMDTSPGVPPATLASNPSASSASPGASGRWLLQLQVGAVKVQVQSSLT